MTTKELILKSMKQDPANQQYVSEALDEIGVDKFLDATVVMMQFQIRMEKECGLTHQEPDNQFLYSVWSIIMEIE